MGKSAGTSQTRRQLVLVTGMPRSGTTWVADILGRCSGAVVLQEPFNPDLAGRVVRACDYRFDRWFTYITDENAAAYEQPLIDMLAMKHPTLAYLKRCRSVKDGIDVLYRAAQLRLARLASKTTIVKDPIALLSAEWLERRFGAKVIVMIRHPAAVVSSFKKLELCVDLSGLLRQPLLMRDLLGPLRGELEQLVAEPHDRVDQAAMLWRALHLAVLNFRQRHPQWLLVRHEDLSRDPMGGFEKMCEYAGLEFSPAARRAAARADDATLPAELDARLAFSTRRNALANLTTWRTRLSAQEIERIRQRVAELLPQFYGETEWS